MKKDNGLRPLISAVPVDEIDVDQIMSIHRNSGHMGVRHATYFVKRICPMTTKLAIWMGKECQSIDTALIHWEKRKLEMNRNWQRQGMDITQYGTRQFLMFTDCEPSCFSIWKQLARQDSASVIRQLEVEFFKHSPPHKLLTDNTAFCSREFTSLVHE